jgi:hypothetical protein
LLDSSDGRQNPATATRFRQSDIKIHGPLAIDSSYQQTPMPGGGRFPQTCARMKSSNLKNDLQFLKPKIVFLKIKKAFMVKQ